MKRWIALVALTGVLGLSAAACDDAPRGSCDKVVDRDDCRLGPGDGVDEPGPGR